MIGREAVMRVTILILLAAGAGVTFSADPAPDSWPVPVASPDSSYPGTPAGLEVEGDRLYLATRRTLASFDVSDPANPVFEGGSLTSGNTQRFAVGGGNAYLVGYHDGLEIHAVANPAAGFPRLGSYEVTGADSLIGLGLAGDRVFASGHGTGLVIIDTSIPEAPDLEFAVDHDLGTTDHFAAEHISIIGDLIYLAGHDDDWGAVTIYRDVPDHDPVFLGDFRVYDIAGFSPPGASRRIEVVGSVAFVADSGLGLYMLDVSDPTSPSLLAVPDVEDVLPESVDDFVVAGNLLLAADASILRILDVGTPDTPVARGEFDLTTLGLGVSVKLAAEGSVGYVAGDQGLATVDISNPDQPALLGSLPITGRRVRDLEVVGDRGYTVGEDGIGVLDLSAPEPVEIGRGGMGAYEEISVHDNRAAARISSGNWIDLFDLGADGSTPKLGETLRLSSLYHFDLAGDRLYVTRPDLGLITYDVSDPTLPVEVAQWNEPAQRLDFIEVQGTTLFAGSFDLGFAIYDLSDPAQPLLLGSIGDSNVSRFVIDGSLAYGVRRGPGGPAMQLIVIDLSNLSQPAILGSANGPGYHSNVLDLAVSGGFVFAALSNENSDLRVFDVRRSSRPVQVYRDFHIGLIDHLATRGGLLYFAHGYAGLHVLDPAVSTPRLCFTATPGGVLPVRMDWSAPDGIYFDLETSRDLETWNRLGRFDRSGLEEAVEEMYYPAPNLPAFFRVVEE